MNPAPTVKELNAIRPDSLEGLIQFLLALPLSHEAAIFYASIIGAAFGFFLSWAFKYAIAKTVDDCVWAYFFKSHGRRTMGAVLTYFSGVVLSITTGAFDNGTAIASSGEVITNVFAGWQNVFSMCISAAMAADGTINKGAQGQWSPLQRAREREKQESAAKDGP